MATIEIPSMRYEIVGDMVSIEQGGIEPASITLHKLHVKLLARTMGLNVGEMGRLDMDLENCLKRTGGIAKDLHDLLSSVPSFPSRDHVDEDVLLAGQIVENIGTALRLLGKE